MRSDQTEERKRFWVYLVPKPGLGGPFVWDSNRGSIPDDWKDLDYIGSRDDLEEANDLGRNQLEERREHNLGDAELERGAKI